MRQKFLLLFSLAFSATIFSSCEETTERYCFTVSERSPIAGQRITFNGSCSEGIELYHWNFGDGRDTVTNASSVTHSFELPGTYEVSLHRTFEEIQSHCPPNAGPDGARQTVTVKN